ncbi:MAG: DUF6790 family protein [Chitinispirillaceae bacterium]
MDFHLVQILVIMVMMPLTFSTIEMLYRNKRDNASDSGAIIFKWILFWAVGIRSVSAGLVQLIYPQYTAETIFELTSGTEFYIFIRELGVANFAIGTTAIISAGLKDWRLPTAFISLIFNTLLAINHIIHFQAGANQFASLGADFFVVVMLSYFLIKSIFKTIEKQEIFSR